MNALSGLFIFSCLICIASAIGSEPAPAVVLPERIQPLVDDAQKKLCPMESASYRHFAGTKLSESEVETIVKWLEKNTDFRSLFVLLILKQNAQNGYEAISIEARAKILISSLENTTSLNDWGYLDPQESHDGMLAKTLVALGDSVLPLLKPVLDNKAKAPLFGTEEATMSYVYDYRRCDFAYRYISLIQGKSPAFEKTAEERDKLIKFCKQEIEAKTKEKNYPETPQRPVTAKDEEAEQEKSTNPEPTQDPSTKRSDEKDEEKPPQPPPAPE